MVYLKICRACGICIVLFVGVRICAVCGVYAICRVVNDFNVGSGEKVNVVVKITLEEAIKNSNTITR